MCFILYVNMFVEQPFSGHGDKQGSTFCVKQCVELDTRCLQLSLLPLLNYLSLFLPPNRSTPVGQMGIEAGSYCCNKIGGCCLLRSL